MPSKRPATQYRHHPVRREGRGRTVTISRDMVPAARLWASAAIRRRNGRFVNWIGCRNPDKHFLCRRSSGYPEDTTLNQKGPTTIFIYGELDKNSHLYYAGLNEALFTPSKTPLNLSLLRNPTGAIREHAELRYMAGETLAHLFSDEFNPNTT